MKVALIHPHIGYKGGLETRLWNYLSWLREHDHHVTLFGYRIDPAIQLPDGVKLHAFDFSWVPKPIRMLAFHRALGRQKIRERFDFSLSLGRTAHQTDLLVPGVHRAYLRAISKKGHSPIDWQNGWLDDLAYKRSERIWAASSLVKQQILDYHRVDPDKIRILYPPLDTQKFNRAVRLKRNEIKSKYNYSDADKVVLFVSSSHFLKGWPFLKNVWKQITDPTVKLLVAGRPVDMDDSRITSAGFVQEMQHLFGAADLVVVPSLYESFCQVVSESLACGTPVLVSERVGAKEILQEPWGRVLPHDDLHIWAEIIREMLDNSPTVPTDIAERHHLGVEEHMQRLLGQLS